MGEEFEVIVLPIQQGQGAGELEDNQLFNLSVYATITPDDSEEDAIWEKYVNV